MAGNTGLNVAVKVTVAPGAEGFGTVLKADKIIVLEHGQVAAEGTHAELIQTSPIYQEIYASQLGNGFKDEAPGPQGLKEVKS